MGWRAELARAAELWPVYDEAFGDRANLGDWRDTTLDAHCVRRDFRLDVAYDNDELAGFAYGYVGDRGQYWSDRVVLALGAEAAEAWVAGHFEFVDLAVRLAHRRRGIGGALHDALLAGAPSDRAMLSTDADDASPAVLLYQSRGWVRLGLLEPGVQVMGRLL